MTILRRYRDLFSSQRFITFTICTAMFTDGYICSVIAPIIPYIVEDSSLVLADQVQMATSVIVACFGVSDIIGGPLCAWYIDTTSNRRTPFLAGLAFMATGTALFGLGNSLWMLAVGRVVQGFASSILYTAGLAVLVDTVKKDEVGKWMGTAMSCNNIALILSPVIGGIMYEILGKTCVFVSMLGLIVVDAALRMLMVDEPKKNARRDRGTAYKMSSRSVLESEDESELGWGLLSEKPVLEEDQQHLAVRGQASASLSEKTTRLTITTISPQSSRPMARHNQRHLSPCQPSRITGIIYLLRSPRLLAALYGTFVNETLVSSLCAILPLFASRSFNWSSLISGLLFLTIAIPGLCGPLAGHLADKLGAKPVAIAGFLSTAPTLAALRFVEDVGSDADEGQIGKKVLLCTLLILSGFTIIFFLSPLGADLSLVADEVQEKMQTEYLTLSFPATKSLLQHRNRDIDNEDYEFYSEPPTLYASTFSMMNCALATATVVGPLVTGGLNQEYGWKTATAFMGVLCLSGAVPCWFFTGEREQDGEGKWPNQKQGGYEMVETASDGDDEKLRHGIRDEQV